MAESLQQEPRDRPVIEVTPAMIEAGLYAFCEFDPDGSGPSSAETVALIFSAMSSKANLSACVSASIASVSSVPSS